jgi:hypothetical protein
MDNCCCTRISVLRDLGREPKEGLSGGREGSAQPAWPSNRVGHGLGERALGPMSRVVRYRLL